MNKAKNIANNYIREKYSDKDILISSIKLDVTKDLNNDEVKMAYSVKLSNGNTIYVDSNNGNIIFEDVVKGYYKGKALAYEKFRYSNESLDLANNGINNLGYNMLPRSLINGNLNNVIKSAVTTDGCRALYADVHGSPSSLSTIGSDRIKAEDLRRLYPKLQLRFVFLDACKTGQTNEWAKTFKISNSWGAFIGWKDDVGQVEAYEFSKVFWEEANGRKPILKAVQNAESRVYTETDPVFIGNSTFYGNAY